MQGSEKDRDILENLTREGLEWESHFLKSVPQAVAPCHMKIWLPGLKLGRLWFKPINCRKIWHHKHALLTLCFFVFLSKREFFQADGIMEAASCRAPMGQVFQSKHLGSSRVVRSCLLTGQALAPWGLPAPESSSPNSRPTEP